MTENKLARLIQGKKEKSKSKQNWAKSNVNQAEKAYFLGESPKLFYLFLDGEMSSGLEAEEEEEDED